jgi:hypothetical protein
MAAKQSLLPEDGEFLLAKSYLSSKIGVKHPVNFYEHLTTVIMHALESKNNVVGRFRTLTRAPDSFEKLSLNVKNAQFSIKENAPTSVHEVSVPHIQGAHAKQRLAQLKVRLRLLSDRDQQKMLTKQMQEIFLI